MLIRRQISPSKFSRAAIGLKGFIRNFPGVEAPAETTLSGKQTTRGAIRVKFPFTGITFCLRVRTHYRIRNFFEGFASSGIKQQHYSSPFRCSREEPLITNEPRAAVFIRNFSLLCSFLFYSIAKFKEPKIVYHTVFLVYSSRLVNDLLRSQRIHFTIRRAGPFINDLKIITKNKYMETQEIDMKGRVWMKDPSIISSIYFLSYTCMRKGVIYKII